MRAVIYATISEDHERAESVPTQIANGTKYAERMSWDVVRVFKDKVMAGPSVAGTRSCSPEMRLTPRYAPAWTERSSAQTPRGL
jgi:hypothetical protein